MTHTQARPPLIRLDLAPQRQDIELTARQREQFASLRAFRFGFSFDHGGDADSGREDDEDIDCEDDGEDIDGDDYANWDKDTEDPWDREPGDREDVDRDDFGYGEEDAGNDPGPEPVAVNALANPGADGRGRVWKKGAEERQPREECAVYPVTRHQAGKTGHENSGGYSPRPMFDDRTLPPLLYALLNPGACEGNAGEAAARLSDTEPAAVEAACASYAGHFEGSGATATPDRAGRLPAAASFAQCDKIIRDILNQLPEAGRALRMIRDQQQWRGSHPGWAEYLFSLDNGDMVRVGKLIKYS